MSENECPKCGFPGPGICRPCLGQEQDEREKAERMRSLLVVALGGARAADTYTIERFASSQKNEAALEAARAFEPSRDNLYLFGPTGTGKSHLAGAAVRRFVEKMVVVSLNPIRFAREVRACRNAADEQDVVMRYAKAGALIIDDLGVEKGTEFNISLLYELVDWRYQNRPGGLIITTNLSLDELAQKLGDDRIPSRIAEMTKGKVYSLAGEQDYRIKQAQGGSK